MEIKRDPNKFIEREPTHPGYILRDTIEETEGLTQKKLAIALGVSFRTISQIVNEHRGVTPDMALRLSKYFGTSTGVWLGMQQEYDLYHARIAAKDELAKIKPQAM